MGGTWRSRINRFLSGHVAFKVADDATAETSDTAMERAQGHCWGGWMVSLCTDAALLLLTHGFCVFP